MQNEKIALRFSPRIKKTSSTIYSIHQVFLYSFVLSLPIRYQSDKFDFHKKQLDIEFSSRIKLGIGTTHRRCFL